MAIGHPAKSGCPFLYPDPFRPRKLIADSVFRLLLTRESNRRFSIQTPSDHSIDHALIAWQSGILQNWGARFCMLSFRPGESNRWLSVHIPLGRSIGHALAAWQSGILQSWGARFCIQSYPRKGFHFLSVRVAMLLNGPVSSTQ